MNTVDPTEDKGLVRFAAALACLEFFPKDRRADVLQRLGVESGWESIEQYHREKLAAAARAKNMAVLNAFGSAFASAKDDLTKHKPTLDEIACMGDLGGDTTVAKLGPMQRLNSDNLHGLGSRITLAGDQPLPSIATNASAPSLISHQPAVPTHNMGELQQQASTPDGAMQQTSAVQPTLSLEQLAFYRAEVATHPDKGEEIQARYGLTPESEAKEAEAWNRRFDAEPSLLNRFRERFQYFRGILSPQEAGDVLKARLAPPDPSQPPVAPLAQVESAIQPVASSAKPDQARLSLEQYACLSAEISTTARDPQTAVYARYGLSHDLATQEVAQWTLFLRGHPELSRSFELSCRQHVSKLRSPGPATFTGMSWPTSIADPLQSRYTVEQYAYICAEMYLCVPQEVATLRARYYTNPNSEAQEHTIWHERLKDPALMEHYTKLFHHYRELIVRQRANGP